MGVPAAIAAVGVGLQVYSLIKDGNDKADAAEANAAVKGMQAKQVAEAEQREQGLVNYREAATLSAQQSGYSHAGVELRGSPLLMMEQTHQMAQEERLALAKEANYRMIQLYMGGDADTNLAGSYSSSGYLNATSTLLTNGAKFYSYLDKNPGTTSNPFKPTEV